MNNDRNRGRDRLMPAIMIWGDKFRMSDIQPPNEHLWVGQGISPVALTRTSWTTHDAIFVGFKDGSTYSNHSHINAGSFVLDADGVRCAIDLGPHNSLEQRGIYLWNSSQNSQQWEVFRYINFVHNTLTVNGQLHKVDVMIQIDSYLSTLDFMNAVLDILSLFVGELAE